MFAWLYWSLDHIMMKQNPLRSKKIRHIRMKDDPFFTQIANGFCEIGPFDKNIQIHIEKCFVNIFCVTHKLSWSWFLFVTRPVGNSWAIFIVVSFVITFYVDYKSTARSCILNHRPLVPHICVSHVGQRCFRLWLVACEATSHYLKQCWLIVNWTLRNKLQWNLIEIQKLSFMKMHLRVSSAKLRPFCPGRDELMRFITQWSFRIFGTLTIGMEVVIYILLTRKNRNIQRYSTRIPQ